MTLSTDQMKGIVSAMSERGYRVGVRDIGYVLLCRVFEEKTYAYRAVFSGADDVEPFQTYSISDKVDDLTMYMERNFPDQPVKAEEEEESEAPAKKADENLSFDQIRKGLEEDLDTLVKLRDQVDDDGNPVLEAKEMATVVGRIADIRAKLVEKFGATQENVEQRILIAPKYTDICPWCSHEIAIDPTHKKLF